MVFSYKDLYRQHGGETDFDDVFVGYAPQLEDFILPQSEDVELAVRDFVQ